MMNEFAKTKDNIFFPICIGAQELEGSEFLVFRLNHLAATLNPNLLKFPFHYIRPN